MTLSSLFGGGTAAPSVVKNLWSGSGHFTQTTIVSGKVYLHGIYIDSRYDGADKQSTISIKDGTTEIWSMLGGNGEQRDLSYSSPIETVTNLNITSTATIGGGALNLTMKVHYSI